MPSIWSEVKPFTVQVASGLFTSNAFSLGGYSKVGIIVPVVNSGFVAFLVAPSGSPTAAGMSASDGPYVPLYDKAGALISAATPGGTGGCAIDSVFLGALASYSGPIKISGAQQTAAAAATYWVHLKG